MLLERGGSEIRVAAAADSTILVLSGVPIAEPIAGYGPFVMNTRQEIETAMDDFRLGKFGRLAPLDLGAARNRRGPGGGRHGSNLTYQGKLTYRGKNFGAQEPRCYAACLKDCGDFSGQTIDDDITTLQR